MAAAERVLTFEVKGKGQFPTDMLRYDRCYPASQNDVSLMLAKDERTVRLFSYREAGTSREPASGRWASFGWEVTAVQA